MTLSGRIRPRASVMAAQENKKIANCLSQDPGGYCNLTGEMRRHEAWMSHFFRSLNGLQGVALSLQRPRTQNPILEVLSAGLSQAWGLPGDRTAAGLIMTGLNALPSMRPMALDLLG